MKWHKILGVCAVSWRESQLFSKGGGEWGETQDCGWGQITTESSLQSGGSQALWSVEGTIPEQLVLVSKKMEWWGSPTRTFPPFYLCPLSKKSASTLIKSYLQKCVDRLLRGRRKYKHQRRGAWTVPKISLVCVMLLWAERLKRPRRPVLVGLFCYWLLFLS